jgi:hypothetical protein
MLTAPCQEPLASSSLQGSLLGLRTASYWVGRTQNLKSVGWVGFDIIVRGLLGLLGW